MGIGETGVGETGVGEMGIGETGVGETGVGETGTSHFKVFSSTTKFRATGHMGQSISTYC